MKITEMIEQLGGNRTAIAKQAGIPYQTLSNQIQRNVEVVELKDGRFVTVRRDATYFGIQQ